MKLSIIIPTYNHCYDLLQPCLETLIKYTDLSDAEVLIVANGCIDDTRAVVESFNNPALKLLWYNEALGFPGANNKALEVAKGDFIVLLNNDVILQEQEFNHWIDRLIAPFQDPSIGITGPLLANGHQSPTGRDFIVFFCAAIKREVFEKIGYLDEIFRTGGAEDIDYCIRTELEGYKLFQVSDWKPGMDYINYPMIHFVNGTMAKVDDWDNIFRGNLDILHHKYRYLTEKKEEQTMELPEGYFTDYDIADYRNLFNQIPINGRMVEIGTFRGRSLCSVADIIKNRNIQVTAIDTFEGTPTEDSELNDYYKNENIIDQFKANIERFGISKNVTIFKGDGNDYAKIVADRSLDLVFIDADHSYEAVKRDIDSWKNKVKYNGILAGHDILWESVKQAVDEKFNSDFITRPNIWIKEIKSDKEILCSISTRGRYFTTLPTVLFAVINQSKLPDHLVLFDDNDEDKRIDLREHEIYQHIFKLLDIKGITWEVIFGQCKGQHYNHQIANTMGYKWVWRVDDDVIPEPNVLKELYAHTHESATVKIGAVGGSIICPLWNLDIEHPENNNVSGKIEDIYTSQNPQWFKIKQYQEVDHLHCSFLYRAGIVDYNLNLSKVAHREESIFTYQLKQKGYKIVIVSNANSYHLKSSEGGIRDGISELYQNDERIFNSILGIGYLVVLDSGIGDHIVFKSILPELKEKYGKITIACCYPFVFDQDEDIISIGQAKNIIDIDNHNIYKFMAENNWTGSMQDAYRKLYL